MSLLGGGECRERGVGKPEAGVGGRQVPGRGVSGRWPPGAVPGASEGGARSAGLRAQRDRGSIILGPNQLILINCQQ